uniref:Tryptophan synthase alpha chain n=1 Tax=Melanthalia intermedia TaxID=172989 RepID=A0A345UAJ8_9FLOR|nr:tryptophan synthase alpha subunit [Melanthalia intermedia]AXI97484.1 tryptophan synthase alpha subunit [Melanthalia intermedia]
MNMITEVLRTKNSSLALIPFITAGYPDIDTCIKALHALDQKGADIIELGLPYSDPLADGPIIQEASKVALQQGIYIDQVLFILNKIIPFLKAPIVIFTYYNPVLSRGVSQFIKEISQAGAQGIIIPDLPLEEVDDLIDLCSLFNLELILFVSPTSSQFRIESILKKSPGCIYLLSSCGVTGIRQSISLQINELAKCIKARTSKLIILGFGISTAEQVSKMTKWNIDGIVIGTAIINSMANKSPDDAIVSLSRFCKEIKSAIDTKI